jgi:hypothetical protein
MSDSVAPIEDGNVSLSTLVRVVADDVEEVSSPSELAEYAPSEGRVAEVTTDGAVYVGDGQQWVAADSDLGLSTALSDTERLSVGGTGPITGVVGDTGDKELLGSFHATVGSRTTSTSYTLLMNATNTPRIPYEYITDVTGYSSFYISFTCDHGDGNGTTDPVYVRLRDWPSTKIKSTSASANAGGHSPRAQIDLANSKARPYIEGKAEGGAELAFDSPTLFVWGEVA